MITSKSSRRNCFQRRFQFFQQANILDVICGIFFIKLLQPRINTLNARSRTGEQGFFQTGLKQLSGSLGFAQIHFQLHLRKNIKSIFFLSRGMATLKCDFSFQERTADLIFDIFFETPDAQSFNIFGRVVFWICNSSRIKHIHQRCKTLCSTVMRRCRQHNHCIAPICKELCEAGTLSLMISAFRNILRFINNDDIPICIFQMSAILNITFQSVYRNNRLIIIEKRIIV